MLKERRIDNLWLFNFAADFAAVTAAYYTTLFLRFNSVRGERFFTSVNRFLGVRPTAALPELFENFYIISAPRILLFLTVALCLLYAMRDLYTGRRFIRRHPVAWNVIVANLIALGVFYAYWYLRRNVFHPRSMFATILFLNIFYCVGFRSIMERWLDGLRKTCHFDERRAILIGSSEETGFLSVYMAERHPHGLLIAHQIGVTSDEPIVNLLRKAEQATAEHNGDMLIVADKRFSVAEIMRFLELAEKLNIPVKILSDRMNVLVGPAKMSLDTIAGIPLVHFDAPKAGRRYAAVQQRLSVVVAWAAAILLLPVFGLVALLIRLSSKGPVFFVQDRIGVNRRPFRMVKFRTMFDRSDEIQAQVEEFNESGKGLFKMRRDPRVTLVGRFLRRFSLDELPQLFNVMRGEMTLVGPRPLPRRDFENYYEKWHYSRHSGMPGLTCLWQTSGRSDLGFHDMCILDVFYLRNQNWVLDLKILLKTFWVVLFAKGAY